MSKMDDRLRAIETGQAKLIQRIDDFMGQAQAHREEQHAVCEKHYKWTESVQKRLEVQEDLAPQTRVAIDQAAAHELIKQRVIGASKLAAWAAPLLTALIAAFWKVVHHKGGTP